MPADAEIGDALAQFGKASECLAQRKMTEATTSRVAQLMTGLALLLVIVIGATVYIDGVTLAAADGRSAATQVLGAAGELSKQSEQLASEVNDFLVGVKSA